MFIDHWISRPRVCILLVEAAILIGSLTLVLLGEELRTAAAQGQDGPAGVVYGNVYKSGELKIQPHDLATLPPLPAGYEALNKRAYSITTSAVVSGPHIVTFNIASIQDEDTFRKLRIFHAEPDAFDPESPVWTDRTVLSSTEQGPNFAKRSINATTENLGLFVIGKQVGEVQANSNTAEIVVTCDSGSDRVAAPNPITYNITVLNRGPDTATDVGLIDSLSGPVSFTSYEPSRGVCKKGVGSFYCKLGSLKPGESATITVKLQPDEGKTSFPDEGVTVINSAFAKAQEKDPDEENNRSSDTTVVLPDSNLPPAVTLVSPKDGELHVGPAEITFEAIATDDRMIKKVEFYDGGVQIGEGTSTDGKRFALTKTGITFGRHNIWAKVTDSGGRTSDSVPAQIIVNGLAKVNIESPGSGSVAKPETDLILIARVSHPSDLITKVEVFANDWKLGEAKPVGRDKYRFTWKPARPLSYSIVFVATDSSGITTTSLPAEIVVSGSSAAEARSKN